MKAIETVRRYRTKISSARLPPGWGGGELGVWSLGEGRWGLARQGRAAGDNLKTKVGSMDASKVN